MLVLSWDQSSVAACAPLDIQPLVTPTQSTLFSPCSPPAWNITGETPEEFEAFLNRTALAIVTGNSSVITGTELRRAIRLYLEETQVFMVDAQLSIWNNTGGVTYNPTTRALAVGLEVGASGIRAAAAAVDAQPDPLLLSTDYNTFSTRTHAGL